MKPTTALSAWFRLIRLFMALQTVMLVIQVLVALFLGVGNLRVPTTFLHNPFGPENGILKMVMTVEVGGIFNQVGVIDITPPAPVSITDAWDVPRRVVYGTGYELAELYGLWHDDLLWIWTQKRRPVLVTGRPGGWVIV